MGSRFFTRPNSRSFSFRQFVWLWNKHQGQTTPLIHLNIACWLEKKWTLGEQRLVLLSFRSAGKSSLIGAFCAWLLFQNSDLRILVLSAECELAKRMVRNIKTIIERHPLTKNLKPRRTSQWSADQFTVNRQLTLRDPSLVAKGIAANITGSRADIVICDDVEVPNTSSTSWKRHDLRQRLDEINYVLVPGGLQIYAGTPHSIETIYAEQIGETGYQEDPFLQGFHSLKIPLLDKNGKSRWPERFPEQKIRDLKQQSGPVKFASQMLLQPIADEDIRLDPRKITFYEADLCYHEGNRHGVLTIDGHRIISGSGWWDPSYGSPDQGDASVVAAVFLDEHGHYWLHRISYLTHDPSIAHQVDEASQLCRQVAQFVYDTFLPSMTIETNGLGRFLPNILRKEIATLKVGCKVIEHASHKNKELRILDALDPVLAARALNGHESIKNTPFIKEMRNWRPGGHSQDDGLDAVSGCILAEPIRLKSSVGTDQRRWNPHSQYQVLDTFS